jgi:predicted metal-binding protein
MMLDGEKLIKLALESNASGAAILETSVIQFHEDVRKACEKNVCRKYDTNWMGPPAIGPVSELSKRAQAYRHGLIFQTIHRFNSSVEYAKGMFTAAGIHEKVFRQLLTKIGEAYPSEEILPLNVGCCNICEKCAYLDRQPCRNPDQAVSSVEAYGINVMALQKSSGLPYNNGKNSVTYVGLILFNSCQPSAIR